MYVYSYVWKIKGFFSSDIFFVKLRKNCTKIGKVFFFFFTIMRKLHNQTGGKTFAEENTKKRDAFKTIMHSFSFSRLIYWIFIFHILYVWIVTLYIFSNTCFFPFFFFRKPGKVNENEWKIKKKKRKKENSRTREWYVWFLLYRPTDCIYAQRLVYGIYEL